MIKFEKLEVVGWEHAIRGMRNPLNSWDKSDSGICVDGLCMDCEDKEICNYVYTDNTSYGFCLGKNDYNLMMKLRNSGPDHRKFMRKIIVYLDITAPLYWWKEFDTYKVGTVANSCSTMHKIHAKEFVPTDFSCERLNERSWSVFEDTINELNYNREMFIKTKDKMYWEQMIQLLPTSYNQKRTVMLNYEVLTNIYRSRKNHKLKEWHELCDLIETLPYSELITGSSEETSFQEDLDFFVNDCTNAQLEALYKEVEKKLKEKGLVNV